MIVKMTCYSDLVSIHARHCWRARPPRISNKLISWLFQSTPAIAGGRDPTRASPPHPVSVFQSTPAIAGGRDKIAQRINEGGGCFNPRPPLLAGETFTDRGIVDKSDSFNPRPPLLAGETYRVARHVLAHDVSIHARHCWRARHQPVRISTQPVVSIHARHCWRARPLDLRHG